MNYNFKIQSIHGLVYYKNLIIYNLITSYYTKYIIYVITFALKKFHKII
jgi:hypothetical protein